MNLKMIFAATALAAMTMSSCSSDTPVDPAANLVKGEKTYASFNVNLKSTGSRANGDDNADAVEQTISSVTLYIFSGGVLEKSATPELQGSVTVPVEITTGEKIIYVVTSDHLNFSSTFELTEESTLLVDFEKQLASALATDIADPEEFLMIGSQKASVVKCTEAEAKAKPVAVTVTRAAAKLQVKYDTEAVTVRPTLNAAFGDAEFAVAQSSRQMYVTLKDGMYTPQGTASNGVYGGYEPAPATFEDGYFIKTVTDFTPGYDESKYTGENVVASPVTGNTTFALVRLKVTPASYYNNGRANSNGDFWVAARNDKKTATWIFASDESYNLLYFATEKAAKDYISAAKLGSAYTAVKYAEGMSYYRVNIITDNTATDFSQKYCVKRNNYYKINVTDIKALGAPTAPGVVPTDPDQPLESDSWLAADITCADWNPIDQNATLQ